MKTRKNKIKFCSLANINCFRFVDLIEAFTDKTPLCFKVIYEGYDADYIAYSKEPFTKNEATKAYNKEAEEDHDSRIYKDIQPT